MKSKLFNWVGGVSALITILLALTPFIVSKVSLDVYLTGGDYLISPKDMQLLPSDKSRYDMDSADKLYTLNIRNDGNETAKDVTVIVPYSANYTHGVLVKNGKAVKHQLDLNMVNVGSLKPSESVILYIWTGHDLYPSFFSSSNIVVAYEGGTSTIKYEVDGSGLFGYLDRYSLILYFLPYLFFIVIPMFFYNQGKKSTNTRSDKELPLDDTLNTQEKLQLIKSAWEDGVLSEEEFKHRYKDILNDKTIVEHQN
ncbi:hypothetical protein [Vibrio cholerae]|uniref:hypothetical protein n=1 Tax=Vibrio cholerae TaxID=666 RepID=UPI001C2FBAB8